jgi:hypothetical protein
MSDETKNKKAVDLKKLTAFNLLKYLYFTYLKQKINHTGGLPTGG